MMEHERILTDELRALAAAEPREAPAWVEERLVDAFRFRVRAARRRKIAYWTGAAAAAVVAACVVILAVGSTASVKPTPARATPAEAVPAIKNQVIPVANPAPARVQRHRVRVAVGSRNEIATSFYELPEAEGLPPAEDTSVIRVEVPRATLLLVGLPVSQDRAVERITADLLVGQDGLARAVRFVQ